MTVIAREPIALHGLRFDIAAVSEQGPRTENQDAFSIDTFSDTGIVAVADGMGGERSGRLAADTALEVVVGTEPIRSLDDARRTTRQADATVSEAAERRPEAHGGMGCALGFLSLVSGGRDGTGWVGAHVGDVRILSRSPDGVLRLETRDHTPAFARWEAGEISLDEIPDTAGANRLQRAVGRGGEADVAWLPVRPGWSWVIVSDGIYKAMRLDELGRVMALPSAQEAVEAIRQKVLERGPDDNFTAVVVRALSDTDAAPLPHEDTLPMTSTPSPAPVNNGKRRGAGFATALATLSLIAAGGALWLYWESQTASLLRQGEVESLRTRVDSLGAIVQELREPFGPTPGAGSQPDSLAAVAADTLPATQTDTIP